MNGSDNRLKLKLLKRLVIISLFILFYFTLLRPFRNHFSAWVIDWITTGNVADYILNVEIMTRSFVVDYSALGAVLTVAYIPQFGFFFLLGMLGLLFYMADYKIYGYLVLSQVVFEMLVLGSLWFGFHYSLSGFITANFLMVYLSPLVCLGFIFYVVIFDNSKNSNK